MTLVASALPLGQSSLALGGQSLAYLSRPGTGDSSSSRPSVRIRPATPEYSSVEVLSAMSMQGYAAERTSVELRKDLDHVMDSQVGGSSSASSTSQARTRDSSRRRSSASTSSLVVNTCRCTGKSAKDLYTEVAKEMNWTEVDVGPRRQGKDEVPKKKRTILCVTQTADMIDTFPQLGPKSWVSRYAGCPDLCDKGNFARMVAACQPYCDDDSFDFIPETWVLPAQLDACRAAMEKSKRTFIVKPEDGSQGDGIFLIKSAKDLVAKMVYKHNAVVQRYIEKPLLLQGVKFDLRMYVCLIGGSNQDAPQVFLCKEGLARFCTENYAEPTAANMHKCMGHLTNYSLNKRSDKFEHSGTTLEEVFDPHSMASKRPLTAVLTQMEEECDGFNREAFYDDVKRLVSGSVAVMAPVLRAYQRPYGDGGLKSFQILGFDVILDRGFKASLLEINNNPSLCIDEALPLEEVSPRLVQLDEAVIAHQLSARSEGVNDPTLWASQPAESVRASMISGRVSTGKTREKGKVCQCMDMAQPHWHQTALVDLVVKKEMMIGAFRLLQQVSDGSDIGVNSYLGVSIDDDSLYLLLTEVESLFQKCGGGEKAFTTGALRRNFGPLCGNGSLQKLDLDTMSQKYRFPQYVSKELGSKAELRVFDFLSLLRTVSEKAFPALGPKDAINAALQRVNL